MNYIEIATHVKKSNFSIKELWKLSSKPESYLEELEESIKKEIELENYSQNSNIFRSYSAISDLSSTNIDRMDHGFDVNENTFSLGKRESPENENIGDIDDFLVCSKTVKKKKKTLSRVSLTNSASKGNRNDKNDKNILSSDQKTRKSSPFKSPIKLKYPVKNIDWENELKGSSYNEETSTIKKELSGRSSAQREIEVSRDDGFESFGKRTETKENYKNEKNENIQEHDDGKLSVISAAVSVLEDDLMNFGYLL